MISTLAPCLNLKTKCNTKNTKVKSNELARMIVNYIQPDKKKIVIVDFSSKGKKLQNNQNLENNSSYLEIENNDYISILVPQKNQNVIGQVKFINNLQALSVKYEKIIICGDNTEALTLLRAVQKTEFFHIMIARIKYSRSDILKEMMKIIPVKGLIYE